MYNILKFNKAGIDDVTTMSIDYNGSDFSTFKILERPWIPNAISNSSATIFNCVWDDLEHDYYGLFENFTELTDVEINFPSLRTAVYTFVGCQKLKTAKIKAETLYDSLNMFGGLENLETVSFYAPKVESSGRLIAGTWQGTFIDCPKLKFFIGDLTNLNYARDTFNGCTSLENFICALPNLSTADKMFNKCKLNAKSVMYILESIPSYTEGNHVITIGINVSSSVIDGKNTDTQLLEFANEIGYDTWNDLKTEFSNKGWSVVFQYSGSDTSITLNDGETGCPIYVKLIEITDEEEKLAAEYCSEDGSKFYNLYWGHDVTD